MFRKCGLTTLALLLWILSNAQAPGGLPYGDPEPVELDTFNIILLIVVPILLIVIYLVYNRKKRNEKK